MAAAAESTADQFRSKYQQDYDRLLFSTPVRRLSDKTQVWPMDANDGVRTRLTHSHEVANLARSIGTRIYKGAPTAFAGADLHEVVQPILLAIGLAHDLGNPPFGHQGETAIKAWFSARKKWIFTNRIDGGEGLPTSIDEKLRLEFLKFDGNPQSLRLLTKLQTSVAHVGLDLTAATLSASLKYPVGAAGYDKNKSIRKKIGYSESERSVVEWFRRETGLDEGQRHPLTWIMEACDDIAYSVLDVDDAMKKGVVSPDDVFSVLTANPLVKDHAALTKLAKQFEKARDAQHRPEIARDIKIGYFRATMLDALVAEASGSFADQQKVIMNLGEATPLMDVSALCKALKAVAQQYAFAHSDVLKMEAFGAAAIDGLLGRFWSAIDNREEYDDLLSPRTSPIDKYVFALISPNYLESAVRAGEGGGPAASIRYRELRLLTDMVSGMTDSFTIKLWNQLKEFDDTPRS
ncbi:MAG: dNTP triphosphohydrolase [Hyphomonadaceae bacterium]|nr:dNTP triphosphohydrolase [Hyphomonadaceae bacterium]